MSNDFMEFEVVASGCQVPAGGYRAKFIGVEGTNHEEFGEGRMFQFEITDGDHRGDIATRVTGVKVTKKNAAGRMISGIMGEGVGSPGVVSLKAFVGSDYMIQIEDAPRGEGTRIGSVIKL